MMKEPSGLLRVGVRVFKVLAWVSLVVQVLVGLYLLIVGGEAVPVGGVDIPARVVGMLNCVAGVIYFFLLCLASSVIQVLLEIRNSVGRPSAS